MEKDQKQALKLYRKGAENRSEEALYRLALYYSRKRRERRQKGGRILPAGLSDLLQHWCSFPEKRTFRTGGESAG